MPLFTIEQRPLFHVDAPLRRQLPRIAGAPVGVTIGEDWPAVRAYAERVDRFARVLDRDTEQQTVYAKPSELEAAAKNADTWGTDESAGELRAKAKLLATRAAKRGAEQTAKDLAFAAKWDAWVAEWRPWFDAVQGSSPGVPPSQAWERIQAFEGRLRELHAQFAALGGTKATEAPPTTFETPTGKADDVINSIPWKWIAGGAIAIGVGVAFSSVAKIVRG